MPDSEIVLVRHGQASFGSDDYDRLSPLGHEQSRWLGGYMHTHAMQFDRVFRGSLRRHRETAQGIAQTCALPAVGEDPRLDELHFESLATQYMRATGTAEPQSRGDFTTMFPRLFEHWARGEISNAGESYEAFSTRTQAVIDAAIAQGGTTLLVTSGGVIGVTLARVLGLNPATTADLLVNIHNASLHRLIVEDGRLRLSLFNASPHLDAKDRRHARTYI